MVRAMKREIVSTPTLRWIDILDPTKAELLEIAKEFHLHELVVQDCLDPKHLPKFETIDGAIFTILRLRDPEIKKDAMSVQTMTRKIAIFVRDSLLLTVHRAKLPAIDELSVDFRTKSTSAAALVAEISKRAVLSFDPLLEEIENQLDPLAGALLSSRNKSQLLVRLHRSRRRLSIIKRLLWHTSAVIQRFPRGEGHLAAQVQDLRETVESLLFFADDLHEEATSLLNLEISMASHRTNEVIRVLTVFSVFFLPLTFLVGVYGMNFEFMPELKWKYGYLFAWGIMAVITLGIALWFKRKGWLQG